jgi:hypothetical protein
VGARPDRPQQPCLDQQLEVMAHGRCGDLVVLHERHVAGGERLVTDRERAQGTDPQRVGQDPKGPSELRVSVRSVVPALLQHHG